MTENTKETKKEPISKKIKSFINGYGGYMAFGAGCVACYFAGAQITQYRIALGTMRFHEAGIIKYFNEDGVEVGIEEACKVLKNFVMRQKIK